VPPASIGTVLLTHAHLDHSGLLPRLVAQGFAGPIVTTAPSVDLSRIILQDAAEIQEEDAEFKNKRHRREGRKSPHPVVPLYRAVDVPPVMKRFRGVGYGESVAVGKGMSAVFHDAGHILGSAMIEVTVQEGGNSRRVLFSGDIGQPGRPLIRDPSTFDQADYVVLESTYGDRNHEHPASIEDQLEAVIKDTLDRGGNVIIPTFAVERAQELTFYFGKLRRERRIPSIMVFLDSPMAVGVTEVFRRYPAYADDETRALYKDVGLALRFPGLRLVSSRQESKEINRIRGTCIIMAGSGMCTAGRIKHHLARNISRPESTVLFVGYQARGTLGHELVSGRETVRIHGETHRVRARISQIHGLSAHADQNGLLGWIGHLKTPPKRVFLTHGEMDAATALAGMIRERVAAPVEVPEYRSKWELE
jgi:metallo-beta-lactamase family protein